MNILDFRKDFKGTRSNRFIITPGAMPTATIGNSIATVPDVDDFKIYAKSASFPGSQLGMIPVSYQGRVIKYSGERQFAEWSIQVYDSSNVSSAKLRKFFESWINNGDEAVTHVQRYNNASTTPWIISMDDISTTTVGGGQAPVYKKHMSLYNCWPIDISAIDLNYEAADSFAEFTVTLAYDYHLRTTLGTSTTTI